MRGLFLLCIRFVLVSLAVLGGSLFSRYCDSGLSQALPVVMAGAANLSLTSKKCELNNPWMKIFEIFCIIKKKHYIRP